MRIAIRQLPDAVSLDDLDLVAVAKAASQQAFQLPAGLKHIESSECGDDPLADLAIDAHNLCDLQVTILAGRLDSEEHERACGLHDRKD